DLNIYVTHYSQAQLYNLLHKYHYHIVWQNHTCCDDYSPSTILTITTFGNGHNLIDIVISRTSSTLSPIFQFHSTAVMSFFSTNSLFCTYPSL
ncbi:hypothetical protein F5J12DRAFT_683135, partial [Pisolithus orientalis]|uniref:uncharacterized protein n=1 Tax=Pisolithus orientalis TaxID=936130 RepID=UPI002223F69E